MESIFYCVIPARGGSKRIPRKNIHIFHGKPMLAYTVEAAKRSSMFKSIVVSTDDLKIAQIAKTLGATVPRLRNSELATDTASTLSVIQDAIGMLSLERSPEAVVLCLYPTAVLINELDIIDSISIFQENGGIQPLITLTEYSHPIERAFSIGPDGYSPMNPENMPIRTQDFSKKWHDAGQLVIASVNDWMLPKGPKAPFVAKIFPSYKVSDIDTLEDLERAKILYSINSPLK